MAWHIEHIDHCESTQIEAVARAKLGAPDGSVVVAKTMDSGRGQHGRAWHAPDGGWYASIVLRDLENPQLLTMALGNAVAEVLEVAGVEPQLKWVNDVLVGGRKIAGILVDAESTGDKLEFVVAGIGINLNGATKDWPTGLDEIATTLEQELGPDTCIEDTEPYILEAIGKWIAKVRGGRDDEIIAAFRDRDCLKGKQVQIDELTGAAEGIDDSGRLLVAGQAIAAGTVRLVD